jgi:hypothetical protein
MQRLLGLVLIVASLYCFHLALTYPDTALYKSIHPHLKK